MQYKILLIALTITVFMRYISVQFNSVQLIEIDSSGILNFNTLSPVPSIINDNVKNVLIHMALLLIPVRPFWSGLV
jgi:hypothetical protein